MDKHKSETYRPVLRYGSLIAVFLHSVISVFIIRQAQRGIPPNERFYASTVVFWTEVCKVFVSLAALMHGEGLSPLVKHLRENPLEPLRLAVPAILYTVQNNLIIVAMANISAALYQVTYQGKILTTAFMSVLLLKRKFSAQKWGAIVVLAIGVAIVSSSPSENAVYGNKLVGLAAVGGACLTSGAAGVYLEKLFKQTSQSMWSRNVLLALFSSGTTLTYALYLDGANIKENGFHHGYTWWVGAVIAIQAIGGLVIAVAMKYADNILKCFANGTALIVTSYISYSIGDMVLVTLYPLGCVLVVLAVLLYSIERKSAYPQPTPIKSVV